MDHTIDGINDLKGDLTAMEKEFVVIKQKKKVNWIDKPVIQSELDKVVEQNLQTQPIVKKSLPHRSTMKTSSYRQQRSAS